jgi:aminopeptidase N
MRRLALPLAVVALLTAGCSGGTAATTSQAAPTTTTASSITAAPTTTTTVPSPSPLTGVGDARGLGDSLYPDLGNAGYDVDHYTVDLTWEPTTTSLTTLVTVDARAVAPLETFSLDFSGFDVGEVTMATVPVEYARDGAKLRVSPAAPIEAGEAFSVEILYSGVPTPVSSPAISVPVGWIGADDGTQYVVAEPDAAHSWFPCNDHPLDKATYTFKITVPGSLIAAANGVLVDEITDLGASTWVWEMDQPMPTYLATVVIGDFDIVDDPTSSEASGVPVRNVLPVDLATDPPASLALQGDMLAFLAELFGPYPFAASGIAIVPGFDAALENATLPLVGRDFATPDEVFETVAIHELAHQWIGDSVTVGDWGDIWLNEGFATYTEWLWLAHRHGDAALASAVERTYAQMAAAGYPPPGDPPADDLFNSSVYLTGALTLHALRLEIGDEAFFATLRAYADRYAGGNVVTADFVAVAEEVSGRDLGAFFDAWLHGQALPDLPDGQ